MTSSQPSPMWSAMRPTFRTRPASDDFSDSPDGGMACGWPRKKWYGMRLIELMWPTSVSIISL